MGRWFKVAWPAGMGYLYNNEISAMIRRTALFTYIAARHYASGIFGGCQ